MFIFTFLAIFAIMVIIVIIAGGILYITHFKKEHFDNNNKIDSITNGLKSDINKLLDTSNYISKGLLKHFNMKLISKSTNKPLSLNPDKDPVEYKTDKIPAPILEKFHEYAPQFETSELLNFIQKSSISKELPNDNKKLLSDFNKMSSIMTTNWDEKQPNSSLNTYFVKHMDTIPKSTVSNPDDWTLH